MSWFGVLKYQGWRDAKPQLIENQETKEATIDWIKRNRSITFTEHKRINKHISKINSLNNEEFPLLNPVEPYPDHPLVESTSPYLHPRNLVSETMRDIERHNERVISLISWLGSDKNTHRIVTGDLV